MFCAKLVYLRQKDSKAISFQVSTKSIGFYNFLRKGRVITIYLGNGGYCIIQDGNHMPERNTYIMIREI